MLVTGANSGMGLATTIALARAGARVIMLCRDETRGRAALAQALIAVDNADIVMMQADLADLDSIAAFSRAFHEKKEQPQPLLWL